MNTTVSSRHTTSSKQQGGGSTLPRSNNNNNNNNRDDSSKYDKSKGKKQNGLFFVFGGILLLSVGIVVFRGFDDGSSTNTTNQLPHHHPTASYSESNAKIPRHLKDQQVALKSAVDNNNSNNKNSNNPYEGWQPIINPNQDAVNQKCDSWRTCFKKTHNCPAKCRDSLEDFGTAPLRPGFTPDPFGDKEDNQEKASSQAEAVEWIPDVTVLRRMLISGKDEHGDPWPPPLVTSDNRELCEDIGVFGGAIDDNIVLLNAVPIRGMPLLLGDGGDGESSDKNTKKKKMKRQPRILCMVYTMEVNHHTSIRAIRETWAPGCDGFLAFSTADDPRIPAISLKHDGPEEYGNMVSNKCIF